MLIKCDHYIITTQYNCHLFAGCVAVITKLIIIDPTLEPIIETTLDLPHQTSHIGPPTRDPRTVSINNSIAGCVTTFYRQEECTACLVLSVCIKLQVQIKAIVSRFVWVRLFYQCVASADICENRRSLVMIG